MGIFGIFLGHTQRVNGLALIVLLVKKKQRRIKDKRNWRFGEFQNMQISCQNQGGHTSENKNSSPIFVFVRVHSSNLVEYLRN
jgi:hypothetical protein